jgi:hypothetical protein
VLTKSKKGPNTPDTSGIENRRPNIEHFPLARVNVAEIAVAKLGLQIV